MSEILIRFNTETGEILHYCNAPKGHEPEDNQLIVDSRLSDIPAKRVDVENRELIDDPDYDPRSKIERRVDKLESAAGVGEEPSGRGIAPRLDDIEDVQSDLLERIKALENE